MPDESHNGFQQPVLFRTYNAVAERDDSLSLSRVGSANSAGSLKDQVLIKDVCRATCATPGLFKGVKIGGVKYRGGSVWASNPASQIYEEIREQYSRLEDPVQLFVDLGNLPPNPKHRRRFQSPTRRQSLRAIPNDAITNVEFERLGDAYYGFGGPSGLLDLETDWRNDRNGRKTFEMIQTKTVAYCKQPHVAEKIERCARALVKLRQSRARTVRWEQFSLGIRYTCRMEPPCKNPTRFDDRDAFMHHLMWDHNQPPQDEKNWNLIQELLSRSQITTLK
jgi:hypothetical protein